MSFKRIKIYANKNDDCVALKKELVKKLEANSFVIDNENPEVVIAVGGDGSFIRMIKEQKYDSSKYYVGINCGNLGFLQNINKNDIDDFIIRLKNDDYIFEEISIQETEVTTEKEKRTLYALNEVLIRDADLKVIKASVEIEHNFLENYIGDGLLISTSTGSTAYNLSFGGAIVYNTFHTMQLTPIAPINNGVYRNITNSIVIPEDMLIKLKPINTKSKFLITVDGFNISFHRVLLIEVCCKNKKLKCLRLNNYHFIKTINEKFLK